MHLLHLIARLNDGGPARVVRELALGAVAAGHRVTVLAGRVDGDEVDYTQRLVEAGIAVRTVDGLGRSARPGRDLKAFVRILRLLRQLRPDLVHTHTAKAGVLGRLACRLLGLPCLHTWHGHVLSGYFGPGLSAAIAAVERFCAAQAHCHSLTPRLVHELRDRHRLGRPVRWHCLPIPIAPVSPVTATWHRELASDRPVVGFLGRLAPVKDAGLWLEVLARIHAVMPVQGLVCGEGPERSALEAQARAGGLDVRFTGQIPAGEALAVMDLLLMTSMNEGLPLVAVEAAGCGVPVVAPLVGGIVDLAREGLVLGRRRSAEALAETCLAVLRSSAFACWQADLARRLAVGYAPKAVIPAALAMYASIVRVRPTPGFS